MKVLLINTSERTGGAAVACGRLAKALRGAGIEVKTLVRDKQTNDPDVVAVSTSRLGHLRNKLRFYWERMVIFASNGFDRSQLFKVSIANTGTDISRHPLVQEADILHLHWVNQGFLSLADIKKLTHLGKPIIWTLHDMWPITGICHHARECTKYESHCGSCEFLNSSKAKDLSYSVFEKKNFITNSNIHLVAVSTWLKNKIRNSHLTSNLKTTVIPNVIDTKVFCPQDKIEVRKKLGLPLNKKIIIMGAARLDDSIKGFDYLRQATKFLNDPSHYLLVAFGGLKSDPETFFSDLAMEYKWVGSLNNNEEIAQLYNAADVTVVPSLYETFGQTLIEGMACGCPGVSFGNSGQSDIIDHKVNGYLATYKDAQDMAAGIEWTLNNNGSEALSTAAINKVGSNYTEAIVAEKYLEVYREG